MAALYPIQKIMRCVAHSSQTGQPCKNGAIPGGRVCRFHGGSAPQVKAKAAERLYALVPEAIRKLGEALNSDRPDVVLRAADSILDRNGFKGIERHQDVPYSAEDLEAFQHLSEEDLDTVIRILAKARTPGGREGSPPPAPTQPN